MKLFGSEKNENMRTIKISIIVPVYNVDKYIDGCLKSLTENNYDNIEIIIINDGSSDNSLSICSKYRDNDDRIVLITQKNQGPSSARNAGLDIANGEYVMFADADDWLDTNYIKVLFEKLASDLDVIVFGYANYNEQADTYVNYLLDEKTYYGNLIEMISTLDAKGYFFNLLWNKLYKKSVIGNIRFEKGIAYGEDLLFNSEVFKNVASAKIIKEPLYYYRTSLYSLTNNKYYPNYSDLITVGIKARNDLYAYYKADKKFSYITNSKELEYRIGEILNMYRPQSTLTAESRRNLIQKNSKEIYVLSMNSSIQSKLLKLVVIVIHFCNSLVADFIFTILFVLKNHFGSKYRVLLNKFK